VSLVAKLGSRDRILKVCNPNTNVTFNDRCTFIYDVSAKLSEATKAGKKNLKVAC